MVTKGIGAAREKKEMSSLFQWSVHQRQQNPIIHLPSITLQCKNIYMYVYFIHVLQTHDMSRVHSVNAHD